MRCEGEAIGPPWLPLPVACFCAAAGSPTGLNQRLSVACFDICCTVYWNRLETRKLYAARLVAACGKAGCCKYNNVVTGQDGYTTEVLFAMVTWLDFRGKATGSPRVDWLSRQMLHATPGGMQPK